MQQMQQMPPKPLLRLAPPMSEVALGEPMSFEALFRRYSAYVARLAARLLGTRWFKRPALHVALFAIVVAVSIVATNTGGPVVSDGLRLDVTAVCVVPFLTVIVSVAWLPK